MVRFKTVSEWGVDANIDLCTTGCFSRSTSSAANSLTRLVRKVLDSLHQLILLYTIKSFDAERERISYREGEVVSSWDRWDDI